MEQYTHLKDYVNYFLFQNIERVSELFAVSIEESGIDEFSKPYRNTSAKEKLLVYESQLLDFFNAVLQDNLWSHTSEMIELWKKAFPASGQDFKLILPEDLIAYYFVLKETLLSFAKEYSKDTMIIGQLHEEIYDLYLSIQKCIAFMFKQLQTTP
jgi:hypothetical protein